MIVLEMMEPFDKANKAAIGEVAVNVRALEKTVWRWSGGLAVLIVLFGVFESLSSCNKIHLSLDNPPTQSQNKSTTAAGDLKPE